MGCASMCLDMSVSIGLVPGSAKTCIKKDDWNGVSKYAAYSNRVFGLEFGKVCVEKTGALPSLSVQLYLDDTSNFYEGLGNTRY